eukprot:scaffold164857_cov36-Tisochrysis_lutea.AAC.2
MSFTPVGAPVVDIDVAYALANGQIVPVDAQRCRVPICEALCLCVGAAEPPKRRGRCRAGR